jgi:hypothetical protein
VAEIHAYRLGKVVRWVGRKVFKFTPEAITIGFTPIYWVKPDDALRRHEQEHVLQAMELGRLRFWWEYLGELRRHGYMQNRFEVQARAAAAGEWKKAT